MDAFSGDFFQGVEDAFRVDFCFFLRGFFVLSEGFSEDCVRFGRVVGEGVGWGDSDRASSLGAGENGELFFVELYDGELTGASVF